jgi:hypothetical protein
LKKQYFAAVAARADKPAARFPETGAVREPESLLNKPGQVW